MQNCANVWIHSNILMKASLIFMKFKIHVELTCGSLRNAIAVLISKTNSIQPVILFSNVYRLFSVAQFHSVPTKVFNENHRKIREKKTIRFHLLKRLHQFFFRHSLRLFC